MKTFKFICRTALPLLFCAPGTALAQAAAPDSAAQQVAFSADQLNYDSDADVVTATGNVQMTREGNFLRADKVEWNRKNGEVRAQGNVKVTDPGGNIAYGDNVTLADTLKDGVVENLLLVLADGGRLAADRAVRKDGYTTLYHASYTACPVVNDDGCPKKPTWQITAVKVVHDPVKHRISYTGATLNLFGIPLVPVPGLSHPDGSDSDGGSGLLVPQLRFSRNNGAEIATPYYWRMASNRDLTLTPHVYSSVLPMLEGEYRQLTGIGAFQLHGYLTYGSRLPINEIAAGIDQDKGIRGYLEGNGTFQLDPVWTITASARYVTDRTFLRRYDISLEDRLRSMVDAERIDADSYVSIAGWAFQGLRVTDVGRRQPIALPAIDARWRLADPVLGGKVELQANSLAILQSQAQDSQRAFAAAKWERRSITPLGQELVLTGYARGDLYHSSGDGLNTPALYRGDAGWQGRVIAAAAAELRWPFIGSLFGGTQQLVPRIQVVASPPTRNLAIPNQDSRSVDLEDSNLFALNRFPGYDRWEDGTRITYGFDWSLDLPGAAIQTTVGQSYRLSSRPAILPPGTGLSGQLSDIVGRTTFKLGSFLSLTHRFRLDKDTFALRRNEVDATIGGQRTYAEVSYLRLNRNITSTVEDLRDHEEVRLGGRLQLAHYWSIFGSTVVDLTDKREDPNSSADGFDPVRHRLGIDYEDDCLEVGLTWRKDYARTGDVRRGSTFLLRVALKNLGR